MNVEIDGFVRTDTTMGNRGGDIGAGEKSGFDGAWHKTFIAGKPLEWNFGVSQCLLRLGNSDFEEERSQRLTGSGCT